MGPVPHPHLCDAYGREPLGSGYAVVEVLLVLLLTTLDCCHGNVRISELQCKLLEDD